MTQHATLGRFARAVARVADWGGYVAGLAVVLILVLVCAEVLMRGIAGRSIMIADEVGGYLNVAAVYLGLAYTLKEGGFIRVELLYNRLEGRIRRMADWFILLASFAFVIVAFGVMVRHVVHTYADEIRSTDFTQAPLYLPQLPILAGLFLLGLQFLAYALNRARNLP